MLIVLSPAKRLDFSPPPVKVKATEPPLGQDVEELAKATRKLSRADLRRLMSISEKLADLNHARFQAFDPAPGDEALPAALAFAGDVYAGLDARSLSEDDLAFAQDTVRILSGLYGVLRPLDAIRPYRLEMGTRLRTRRGATLYDFWGDRIAHHLNEAAAPHGDPVLINLASHEYFGAVDAAALKLKVVTPHFKELREGEARFISFHAKKARGLMARHVIENRITRPDDLKGFDREGYRFVPDQSDAHEWLFVRDYQG